MKKLFVLTLCVTTLIYLIPASPKITNEPPIPALAEAVVEAPQEPIAPQPVPEPAKPAETIVEPPIEPTPTSNQDGRCGDNDYAHAIYMGESSCRMDIINSIGACGLGQSLPCDKMASDCPNWRTDYDCQNRWFTAYAMEYGSWENAYNFKFCTGYCYSTRTKTTVFKPTNNPWW